MTDPRISATVVGISNPSRLGRIVDGLAADLPPALFQHLAELMPDRRHWLDSPTS